MGSTSYKIPTVKPSLKETTPPNQGVSTIEFSKDDSYIACKNDNMPFSILIFNTSSLTLESVISLTSHIRSFKWMKEENRLCICTGASNSLLFWKDNDID